MAFDPGGFSSEFGPGTPPPQPPPPLSLNPAPSPLVLQSYGALSSAYLQAALGTQAAPAPIPGNFGIGQLVARGWDGSAYGNYDAALYFRATETHSPTGHGAEIIFFTTPNGSTTAHQPAGVSQGGALWCGGGAALATTATDGFFGVPTMAGAPASVPVINYATAPMVFDTVDKELWVYWGGWNLINSSGGGGGVTVVTSTSADLTVANPSTTPTLTVNSAPKWSAPRTISYTGDATGSGAVDGSANVGVALSLAAVNANVGSFGDAGHVAQITVDAKGRITAAASVAIPPPPAGTVTSVSSANSDLTVASGATTPVLTVNAAPKWDTARTLSFTGAVTGSGVLDGSANVAVATTLGTVSNLTVGTSLTVSNAGGAATLTIDAPAGNLRSLAYTSGGSARWFINCTAVAESGSNAGSDFNIQRRDDTGANLGTAFTIARATGQTNILNGLAINGATAHGVLIGQSSGNPITSTAAGSVGQVLTSQGAAADPTFTAAAGGSSGTTGQNPTASPSGTGSMAGMGAAFAFTPTRNGRVLVTVHGHVTIPAAAAAGAGLLMNLFYGTGTAPANGAASTGTQATPALRAITGVPVTGLDQRPFVLIAMLTGLTVGTPYWVDMLTTQGLAAGGVTVNNVTFNYAEQ